MSEEGLVVPNLLHHAQLWRIVALPAQNKIMATDISRRIVLQVRNYQNGYSFSYVASGIYFYQIRTTNSDGKPKLHKGKLLIID